MRGLFSAVQPPEYRAGANSARDSPGIDVDDFSGRDAAPRHDHADSLCHAGLDGFYTGRPNADSGAAYVLDPRTADLDSFCLAADLDSLRLPNADALPAAHVDADCHYPGDEHTRTADIDFAAADGDSDAHRDGDLYLFAAADGHTYGNPN